MGLLQSTTRPKSYREALLDKKRPSPFVLLDPKQKRVAQFAFGMSILIGSEGGENWRGVVYDVALFHWAEHIGTV
jgi:hypothetical protein